VALVHFEGDAEWLKVAIAGHAASFRVESGAWKDVSCGGNDRLQGRGVAPHDVLWVPVLRLAAQLKMCPPTCRVYGHTNR